MPGTDSPPRRPRSFRFGRSAAFLLVALAFVGLVVHLSGGFLHGFFGGPSGADTSDLERWLDEHEDDASRVAEAVLAGTDPLEVARPEALARIRVRRWPDAVSFTLSEGGFKEPVRGVCFSRSGLPPDHLGTFEEKPARWTRLRGPWYAFAAE